MGADFAEADYYEMFIWTLLDSDTGYENSLIQHRIGTKFFIIYATSPAEERMKPLRQNFRTVHSIVMNPWTRGEIHQVFVTVCHVLNYVPRSCNFSYS